MTHAFAERNAENVYGKRAMDILFSPEGIGEGTLTSMKDLVTQVWMRNGDIETAGVKAFVPSVVGSAIAGKAGGAAGTAVTLFHITPRIATLTRKGLESTKNILPAMGKAIESGVDAAIDTAPYVGRAVMAVKGRAIEDAVEELAVGMGLDLTPQEYYEELNKLKASRVKSK
jgi:hypothetical protein